MVSEEKNNNQLNNELNSDTRPSIFRNKGTIHDEKSAVEPSINDDTLELTTTQSTTARRLRKSVVVNESNENSLRKPSDILDNARKRRANQVEEDENANSRKAAKQAKKQAKKEKKLTKGRIRYIPVWLRVILIAIICGVAFIVGLTVGYGVVGDGSEPKDVLNRELWDHILKYIRGE